MPAVKKTVKKSSRGREAVVNEAAVAYKDSAKKDSILKVVKGPENKLTGVEKMELVEVGIAKHSLESLKQEIGFDYDQLAQVLNVARATLINKKSTEKFNTDLSDKIMNLADIISYGFEVFEDRSAFKSWLQLSNRALGGKKPFDLLHTSFGRDEVRDLLGRIDHGIYS